MALKCMDFVTALSVAQKPFFTESWNRIWNFPAGKDLKIGLDQSTGFPTDETGPERLNDWVKNHIAVCCQS